MNDVFDDPAVKAYLKHAREDMLPKLRSSAVSLTIFNAEPDMKLCCELGAAILLDKPLVILVPDREAKVPANLKRVATALIYGTPDDPAVQTQIRRALDNVLRIDERTRQ